MTLNRALAVSKDIFIEAGLPALLVRGRANSMSSGLDLCPETMGQKS
jgi:hypothetical protein